MGNILGKEIENITDTDVKYMGNIIEKYRDATGREDIEMTAVFTDALFGLSTHKVSQYLVKGANKSVFKYYFSYIGTTSSACLLTVSVAQVRRLSRGRPALLVPAHAHHRHDPRRGGPVHQPEHGRHVDT